MVEEGDNLNNYMNLGYECMFRVSSTVNGLISDCNASFDGSNIYDYTLVGRAEENINNLRCNDDCTSRLDGRLYSSCGSFLTECSAVPDACDGSIYGGWIQDPLNASQEFQCSAPWDNYRVNIYTDESGSSSSLKVESTNECSSLVDREYQVMIDNELVKMHVYICGN